MAAAAAAAAAAVAVAAPADVPKLVLLWEAAVHHALEAYLQHQIPKGNQWMATAELASADIDEATLASLPIHMHRRHALANFCHLIYGENDDAFESSIPFFEQLEDPERPSPAWVALLLELRTQAAIRNTEKVTDTAVFLSAVNRLIPPLPRPQDEPAISAAFRERYKAVRSEFMACLATDEETGEDVVDYDAWAAITERHPFHAFGANLSNYLSELARTLPPPLLDQMYGDIKSGKYTLGAARPAAPAVPAAPPPISGHIPSADILRAAFGGTDAAWQQIVEQKDPAVAAFLQAARVKPARPAAAAAPVAPVAAPRPAAGRASVSPARQRLVLVGNVAGKPPAAVVAGVRRPLQPSTEAQQAELALKQSMAALAHQVRDPLKEFETGPNGELLNVAPSRDGRLLASAGLPERAVRAPRRGHRRTPLPSAEAQAAAVARTQQPQQQQQQQQQQPAATAAAGGGGASPERRLPEVAIMPVQPLNAAVRASPTKTGDRPGGRRLWQKWEVANLVEGMKTYGKSWSQIHANFQFDNRTPGDLKDKARILAKQSAQ